MVGKYENWHGPGAAGVPCWCRWKSLLTHAQGRLLPSRNHTGDPGVVRLGVHIRRGDQLSSANMRRKGYPALRWVPNDAVLGVIRDALRLLRAHGRQSIVVSVTLYVENTRSASAVPDVTGNTPVVSPPPLSLSLLSSHCCHCARNKGRKMCVNSHNS